ncbi:hypothetical protein PR048_031266, partial [Dryococelus australis]
MQLVGGFSRGFPVPPLFHSGATPYPPQSPSSDLKTSLLRAAQISSLTHSYLGLFRVQCSRVFSMNIQSGVFGSGGVPVCSAMFQSELFSPLLRFPTSCKFDSKRHDSKQKRTPGGLYRWVVLAPLCVCADGRQPRLANMAPNLNSKRFSCSPPTKANRVQSPAGSPVFRKWESCRTMPLVGGFFSTISCFLHPFIPALLHLGATVSERLDCSPPTKANRFRPPAGSLRIFRKWESCRTDAGGRRVFSWISRPSRPYIPVLLQLSPHFTLRRLSRPRLRALANNRAEIHFCDWMFVTVTYRRCLPANHGSTVLELPSSDWPMKQENVFTQRHVASKQEKAAGTPTSDVLNKNVIPAIRVQMISLRRGAYWCPRQSLAATKPSAKAPCARRAPANYRSLRASLFAAQPCAVRSIINHHAWPEIRPQAGVSCAGSVSPLDLIALPQHPPPPPTSKRQDRDVKYVYTEVTFSIGSQFMRHALDYSKPIADSQGKQVASAILS